MTAEPDITTVDGIEFISLKDLALLGGIDPTEARQEWERQQEEHPGTFSIPRSWVRGSKELQARHGTKNAFELFAKIQQDRGGA